MVKPAMDLIQNHLPTRKDEEWKYADLSFLKKEPYSVFKWERSNECEYVPAEKKLIVRIFNGLSGSINIGDLPKGVSLHDLAGFKKTYGIFTDFPEYKNYLVELGKSLETNPLCLVISQDFPTDVLVQIEMGAELPEAQKALLFGSGLNVMVLAGASVKILEKISLPKGYFHVSGVDYFVQKNAHVKILKMESGFGGRGGHTSRLSVAENAEVGVTTLTMNSEWSRHNAFAELTGTQAGVSLEAAYLLKDNQFADHHTVIDHKMGQTLSVQKYNGVLADKAKGVFNGKVLIRRDSQKASAVQLNKNLLLSKQAEINTKPELQIDADDVQAKHGATVGQLSEDQLFYLVSRGIPEATARGMLTRGFVEEIGLSLPERLQNEFFKEVSSFVHDRME